MPPDAPQARRGWRDYALLLALACCWSSTYPLTKIGLGSFPPITFISLRSLIAAGFLLVVLRFRGIPMPVEARAWKLFAQQQTINSTFPFLLITWAQQYVPAANTVVLASTTPIFAFLITWGITRHEPATLLKLAGAILGLAGTAVIIGLDALATLDANVLAEIVILIATISFACATIFGSAADRLRPDGGGRGLAVVRRHGAVAVGADRGPSLDLAADGRGAGGNSRNGHILERVRADAVLHVPDAARHAHHQRARLFAHPDRRRPVGVLLGEAVPANLALGLVLVMAGVAAMTIPTTQYRNWLRRLGQNGPRRK